MKTHKTVQKIRIPRKTLDFVVKVLPVMSFIVFVSSSASAMEFKFEYFVDKSVAIRMEGEVKKGDSEKFRLFLLRNLDDYSTTTSRRVIISSNGGDLVEALKLASAIKRLYSTVWIRGKCASACFFLYLSAAHRWPTDDYSLGIHRAYFDPVYFAGLSLANAEQKQKELTALVNSVLDDNSVPKSIIELMNRTSSLEIHWLTKNEREQIEGRPAWYEELLIARCGYDKALENRFNATPYSSPNYEVLAEAYMGNLRKWANCEEAMVTTELKALRLFLAKKSH